MLARAFIIIVTSLGLLGSINILAQSQQPRSDEEKAAFATKLLWSADEAERERGKADIIKLGDKAVPRLIALLRELHKDPFTPRFATGKEAEGKILWERFQTSPSSVGDEYNDVVITSRLQYDLIELLGELRAKGAIPILVAIMEIRMKDNWLRQRILPEMAALAKIGKPAVPALIKSIEEAEEIAVQAAQNSPGFTQEEKLVLISSSVATSQTRAIIVLGEIGDKAALPVLEKLLEENKDPNKTGPDIRYVNEAIRKILAFNTK